MKKKPGSLGFYRRFYYIPAYGSSNSKATFFCLVVHSCFPMGENTPVLIVLGPLAGLLSDRLSSRFGRRRPMMLLASLVAAAGKCRIFLRKNRGPKHGSSTMETHHLYCKQ